MLEYENRLVAELRYRRTDERTIEDARASIKDFPADQAVLVSEFGEPEAYARALTPDSKTRGGYGFALAGIALAVATWITLKLAFDADWAPLVALAILPVGIYIEGRRRTRRRS